MLKTMMRNKRDKTQKLVALPRDFETVKAMFDEQFGYCNALVEKDFDCQGLYCEYCCDDNIYSFEKANRLAIYVKQAVATYGEGNIGVLLKEKGMLSMELYEKLLDQVSEKEIDKVGEIVTEKLLERVPNYYEGGSRGLLNNIIRRSGGHFYTHFRLGYAGFNSGRFYIIVK